MDRIRDPKEILRERQLEEEDKVERERMKAKLGEKESKEEEEEEVVETSLEERAKIAKEFLERLTDLDGSEERGSLLALLELERRIRDESEMKSGEYWAMVDAWGHRSMILLMIEEGVYVRLLARYLRTFGNKPSCFGDLRPYVMSLNGPELEQWKTVLNDIPLDTVRYLFAAYPYFRF